MDARLSALPVLLQLENCSQIYYPHAVKSSEAEYHKKYFQEHRDQFREYSRRDYEKRKEFIQAKRSTPEFKARAAAYSKEWRSKNVEKRREACRQWVSENKSHIEEYKKRYGSRRRELYALNVEQERAKARVKAKRYLPVTNARTRRLRRESIQFALKDRLRATLNRALRRNWVKKSKRTMELVGCTVEELKTHIESLFLPGMSWDNRHLWHVDH